VQLKDDSGNVIATTVTDSRGRYSFNQQTGVGGTGNYTVSVVAPSGYTQTSANPSTILISRGDVNVTGVNFELATTKQGGTAPGSHAPGHGGSSSVDLSGIDALFQEMGALGGRGR
jgi:hypothetical protein